MAVANRRLNAGWTMFLPSTDIITARSRRSACADTTSPVKNKEAPVVALPIVARPSSKYLARWMLNKAKTIPRTRAHTSGFFNDFTMERTTDLAAVRLLGLPVLFSRTASVLEQQLSIQW
jgi:hypothetical protein